MRLKTPSIKEILEDLKIDPLIFESVIRFPLDNYRLTFAESILLYEGIATGIAKCHIPLREIEAKNIEPYNFCISGELLELLLNPRVSKQIFTTGKLTITDAHIVKHKDIERIKRGIDPCSDYTLNLHDGVVDIDLTFRNCTFAGGINMQRTTTKNIIFERVHFGSSFNMVTKVFESLSALDLSVKGSIIFTDEHTDIFLEDFAPPLTLKTDAQEITDVKREDKQVKYHSSHARNKFLGSVNFSGAEISNWLKITSCDIDQKLDLHRIKAADIVIDRSEIRSDILLTESQVKNFLEINFTSVNGSINARQIDVNRFTVYDCFIHGIFNVIFGQIKHLFSCIKTEIVGFLDSADHRDSPSMALDGRGINAGNIFLRDGFRSANGVDLLRCNIKDGIDFSDAIFLYYDESRVAINLMSATIGNDLKFSPNTCVIGLLRIDDARIGRNLRLDRSKFINGPDRQITISAKNAIITRGISFSNNDALATSEVERLTILGIQPDAIQERILTPDRLKQLIKNTKGRLYESQDKQAMDDINAVTDQAIRMRFFEKHLFKQKVQGKLIDDLVSYYELAISYLSDQLLINDPGSVLVNNKTFLLDNTIVTGNTQLSGIRVNGQVDFSGALFFGMADDVSDIHHRKFRWLNKKRRNNFKADNYPNAVTMKFSQIDGEVFLNEGATDRKLPFRAKGEVNLHSSKIGQFFISPAKGQIKDAKWKITGLKYNYIYSNEKNTLGSELQQCDWFYDYDEENNRQPYEELAGAYLRAGDDTKARNVLLRTVGRNWADHLSLFFLRVFARFGTPFYNALFCLFVIWITGFAVFAVGAKQDAFIPVNKFAQVEYCPVDAERHIYFVPALYSAQTMLPFINSDQKLAFSSTFHSGHNFFPKASAIYVDSGLVVSIYTFLHMTGSVIFLSMFIVGITRLIKRT